MTKNDLLYKILFAVELALLPMIFFANLVLDQWTIGLFIGAILLVKVWMEIFEDRTNKWHVLIMSIANVAVFSCVLALMMAIDQLSVALCVIAIVMIVLMNIINFFLYNKRINETISAVDFCYILFECLTLAALTFVIYYELIAQIALISVVLTTIVSVGYKLYYIVRYTDLIYNIKKLFRRK